MTNEQEVTKKKKSSAPKILFGIVVILAFIAAIIFFSADSLLKTGIENAVQKQLGLETTLGSAHVSLLSGKIQIYDLKIKNPQDYKQEYLLELNSIIVEAEPKSLFSNTIEIPQIKLTDLFVTIEQKGLTSNLNDVLKSMPKSKKTKTEPETPSQPNTKKGKNVHVTSLDIENISVNAKILPIPGKLDTIKIKIDKIHLSDIGGDKKVSTAELIGMIVTVITEEIAKKGPGILPKQILEPMTNFLKDASIESVIKAGEDIIKQGENAGKKIEKITEGLKGIFQKKE